MRRYPPEDAHGAGHYYYFVIHIRKSSEPFCLLLGYLQQMAKYWRKPNQLLRLRYSPNKYPMRLGQRSKQG